jgi:hypothetical protein
MLILAIPAESEISWMDCQGKPGKVYIYIYIYGWHNGL